jgi:hypothetical protein
LSSALGFSKEGEEGWEWQENNKTKVICSARILDEFVAIRRGKIAGGNVK